MFFILILLFLTDFAALPKALYSPSQKVAHFSGTEMTIDYHIIIGCRLSQKEYLKAEQKIKSVFAEVNALYNKFNPLSEISHLNRLPAHQVTPISAKLEDLLRQADALVHLTKGKFDPTIEPLQQLWKNHFKCGSEPTDEEINRIKPALGWDKIHWREGNFYKDHSLTSLDLGGIAKGYCVDLLVEELQALGYAHTFVEWGGEIRASGQHPEDRPWRIFISKLGNPDPNQAIAWLDLHNQAVASSGDYMQLWRVKNMEGEERIYSHVFNPHTYYPIQVTSSSIASSSVSGSTCTFADGLAKVGLLFADINEAKKWAEEIKIDYPETDFWFMTRAKAN